MLFTPEVMIAVGNNGKLPTEGRLGFNPKKQDPENVPAQNAGGFFCHGQKPILGRGPIGNGILRGIGSEPGFASDDRAKVRAVSVP